MILSIYDTTVPLHCQRQQEINCADNVQGKSGHGKICLGSALALIFQHTNLKFNGGKSSKANQPTGKICWSIGKLKLWASHSSRSSLSNSSKTSWRHAAFLPLKVNATISWWFISFLCTMQKLSFRKHAQHLSYLIPTADPVLHHIIHRGNWKNITMLNCEDLQQQFSVITLYLC